MNKTYGFRTLAVLALLAVSVVITAACEGNKSRYPTQPEARNFINPETSIVEADFACPGDQFIDENGRITVLFVDNSTGNVEEYFWDFGDGKTSTEQDPAHRYSRAGGYIVVHTVSNSISTDTKKALCPIGIVEEDPGP